jgi:hypothetical protein
MLTSLEASPGEWHGRRLPKAPVAHFDAVANHRASVRVRAPERGRKAAPVALFPTWFPIICCLSLVLRSSSGLPYSSSIG